MSVHTLAQAFVHLGTGATAVVQPPLYPEADDPTGMKWYEDYARRHPLDDGEGWLVLIDTADERSPRQARKSPQ